ncbi:MAG: hypothetical protein AAGJ35_03010, partial [Myxococcota bacterium]
MMLTSRHHFSWMMCLSLFFLGCIPTFKGFKKVPAKQLNPPARVALPPAEILDLKSHFYHRWGQIGQPRRTTFWRMQKRIRINTPEGLKYASIKYLPGGFAYWSPFNRLLKFRLRATCPGNRTVTMNERDLKTKYVHFRFRSFDAVETQLTNTIYKAHFPGIEVGCVLDVMWEYDLALQFNRFFFALTRFSIPLTNKLPIRKAHYRVHYAENLEMRIDLDPTLAIDMLQGQERRKKARLRSAMLKKTLPTMTSTQQRNTRAWLQQLPPQRKRILVAALTNLTPKQRRSTLRKLPKLSPRQQRQFLKRWRAQVAPPLTNSGPIPTQKATVPAKKTTTRTKKTIAKPTRKKPESTPLHMAHLPKHDSIRITHNQEDRIIDIHTQHMPAIDFAKRRMLGGMCARQAIAKRFCTRPSAHIRITRIFNPQTQVYQDIRVDWKNIAAWYTRPTWPLQEDRAGFTRQYQMNEVLESHKDIRAAAQQIVRKAKATTRIRKLRALYKHLRTKMYVQGPVGIAPIMFGMSSGNDLLASYKVRTGNPYVVNMLFMLMARSLGIRTYAALATDNDYDYRQRLPDRDVFHGLLIYIAPKSEGPWKGLTREIAADRRNFTKPGQTRVVKDGMVVNLADPQRAFGSVRPTMQSTEVYIINHGGGRFFRIKPMTHTQNTSTQRFDLTIDKDGTLSGTVHIHATGHEAAKTRRMLKLALPKDWKYTFRSSLGREIASICHAPISSLRVLKKPNVLLADVGTPLHFQYKIHVKHCFTHTPQMIRFRLPQLFPTYQLRRRNASFKLVLGTPVTRKTQWTLRFPQGYQVQGEQKRQHQFAQAMFLKYKKTQNGNTLSVQSEYQIRAHILPQKQY